MSDYIRIGRYQKPWLAEQYLDIDLPGGAGRTWIPGPSFATEQEAVEHVEKMRADAVACESWRVRNRETPGPVQSELFAA